MDLDLSARHFERALALDPGYADAHNNYGNLLLAWGDKDLILWHYTQVRDSD